MWSGQFLCSLFSSCYMYVCALFLHGRPRLRFHRRYEVDSEFSQIRWRTWKKSLFGWSFFIKSQWYANVMLMRSSCLSKKECLVVGWGCGCWLGACWFTSNLGTMESWNDGIMCRWKESAVFQFSRRSRRLLWRSRLFQHSNIPAYFMHPILWFLSMDCFHGVYNYFGRYWTVITNGSVCFLWL